MTTRTIGKIFEDWCHRLGLELTYINLYISYVDLAKVTWPEPNESKSYSKLRPEIIDLKFTLTENDPYQIELNSNIFFLNYFSFQEKSIEPKINWPKIDPKLSTTELCWPKMTRFKSEPNDPFARSTHMYKKGEKVWDF